MTVTGLRAALERVGAAPAGPRVGAFFDLDGTLVDGYTAQPFYRDRFRRRDVGLTEIARTVGVYADSLLGGDPGRLMNVGIAGLTGQREDDLHEIGARLFDTEIATTVRDDMRALVRAHAEKGHTVAIATSATRFQADPVARELGVEHVLCSEVAVEDGRLTGRFDGDMVWKEGKARRTQAFASEHDIDRAASHAYANGDEDIPFLAGVGHPTAVDPQPLLERVAEAEGWPTLHFEEPAEAGLRSVLGTAAAVGGMNVALAAGAGIGLITRSRQTGANLFGGPAMDLSLMLAGVDLHVIGRRNLVKQRPAVFVFNHQSNLDPPIVGSLIRTDYTATGKAEAKRDPGAALAGYVLDAVYLDRADGEKAKARINTLIDRLKEGTSVMIAPEGTRSKTPEPRDFKHGAFHVAMQAGVPVVPIVLRNSGMLLPPGSKVIRGGTCDIRVLEPISTEGWTRESVADHARALRDRMAHLVETWNERT